MDYEEFFKFIIEGNIKAVKIAIDGGYDINEPDKYGFVPLHRACANNQPEIVSLLLQSGSKLGCRGTDDWTALHLTAVSGALDCIEPLAAAGIELDAKDKNGCTALHLSVTSRNPNLAKKLIEVGCNKCLLNKADNTPLQHAKVQGRTEFYDVLN
ncbi:ankyrin repeat domain-containing protein [Pleionea mediterranea]|uniref:Ankyrin repeat protein n=1 Tax=Pleionea mediterranea TaxID=523701 RepID=A0A316G2I7_9GAMM|nr:ankyrin repeat domain-containing protein [Pleionea mediterranea]PWK48597.1 ankyrin repeat protein [Pleionea mediterranea]